MESYSSTLYFSSFSHISFILQFFIWSFILTCWRVTVYSLELTFILFSSSNNKLITYLKMICLIFEWILMTTDFSLYLRLYNKYTIEVFALQRSCKSRDSKWISDVAFLHSLKWYLLLSGLKPQCYCSPSWEGPLQGRFEMTCRMACTFLALLRSVGPHNSLHEDLQELLAWKMAVWNISTNESNALCQAASWHAYCSSNSTE